MPVVLKLVSKLNRFAAKLLSFIIFATTLEK